MSTQETAVLLAIQQNPMRKSWFSYVLVFLISILIGGCANTLSKGGIETRELHTSSGAPVKITRIGVSKVPFHYDVQVAAGSVWASAPGIFSQYTVKIDPKTNFVMELPRPFTAAGATLLVDEHAMWLSDAITPMSGNGDLMRIDLNSNQTIVTITAVGIPFAIGNDMVWTYNYVTGEITGINIKDNQPRTKIATNTKQPGETMTFGAGSLWYLSFEEGTVHRIDPQSTNVLAKIPLSLICPPDKIHYVAGSVWVLNECDDGSMSSATRIDVSNNRVAATVTLPKIAPCVKKIRPRTPVEWDGAIWLSTFCSEVSHAPARLLKIDLQKNMVVDQLILSEYQGHEGGQPNLAVGEGAVWGFDGKSAFRLDF